MRPRLVTKFGGTSLADKKAWLQTLSVLESRKDKNPLIVVSAVGSAPCGDATQRSAVTSELPCRPAMD